MKKRIAGLALLLVILLALRIYSGSIKKGQTFQRMAEVWQGSSDEAYVQLSMYYDPHTPVPASMMERSAPGLADSFGEQDGSPLICWGGSMAEEWSVLGRQIAGETYSVSADYFAMHPFPVASGALPQMGFESGVVLNTHAAWKLFGSVNCVGEYVYRNGHPYPVIAVISAPQGRLNADAFGDTAMVFAPIQGGSPVTFCEAVLPSPVSGEAERQFTSHIPEGELICNSTRFGDGNILVYFRNLIDTQTQHLIFQLPPWEYAARQAERRIGLCFCAQTISLVIFAYRLISFLRMIWDSKSMQRSPLVVIPRKRNCKKAHFVRS